MKKYINWKLFFILLSLSLISVACVFPYILSIQGDIIRSAGIPIVILFIAQFIQCLVLFSVAIFFGLLLAKKIGLELPILEAMLEKRDYGKILKNTLWKSVLWGVVVAAVIYGLDNLFTILGADISTHQNYAPVWQKLLASLYGGVTEEVLLRLFLMTFFIWLGMKLFKQKSQPKIIIIVSILLAAIIFGLGHLPITASLTKLTPLIIGRAIVLNGVGGIIFGWLFWKKGLESAMIAHFTADIFLLSLLPLLFK